jgi:hypothetical protein
MQKNGEGFVSSDGCGGRRGQEELETFVQKLI